MKKPFQYGGQAVIEGVMMLGPKNYAISVRKPDGDISVTKSSVDTIKSRFPFLRLPIIRGVVNLIEMLFLGVKAITWSANESGEEEDEVGALGMTIAILLATVISVVIFIVFPVMVGSYLYPYVGDFGRSAVEGIIRISCFIGYIVLISRMKDIQRLFMYHGAEHKTIACYEHGEELIPENAMKYSTVHRRCGTSFVMMVMIVMIIVFTFVGQTDAVSRIIIKLITMPLIAGVTYEFIKWAANHSDNVVVNILMAPGLWLQKLTTKEPTIDQVEVAMASLKEVLVSE